MKYYEEIYNHNIAFCVGLKQYCICTNSAYGNSKAGTDANYQVGSSAETKDYEASAETKDYEASAETKDYEASAETYCTD